MELVSLGLLGLGGICALVGQIMLVVVGFKASALWGLGILLVPLVSLLFLFTHWQEAKKPFLVWVLGVTALVAGIVVGAAFGQPVVAGQ